MADGGSIDTPIIVTQPQALPGRAFQHEPVTLGVPFPAGAIANVSGLALIDAGGQGVPLQAAPAELWPDGSVRWAFLDFQIAGAPSARREYRLVSHTPGHASPPPALRITTKVSAAGIDVDTGVARFRLQAGAGLVFHEMSGGSLPSSAGLVAPAVTDQTGRVWPLLVTGVTLEQSGNLRCTVRLDGSAGPPGTPLVAMTVRVQFFAGSATTRFAVTLRNPRRARHPGGFWEMGDAGSVLLRDVSIGVAPGWTADRLEFSAELADAPKAIEAPLELYQDSSGGEQWMSPSHMNRRGDVPVRFRGYAIGGAKAGQGMRATPAAVLSHQGVRIGVAIEQFWQNFPKALEASATQLVVRLWPHQFGDLHELQGGEQKTHHFVLIAGDDPMALDAAYWARQPSRASATPEWYCAARAIAHLSPAARDRDDRYARLVGAAIEGPDSFDAKRERIDEYGWRNFGDLYADHENAFSSEPGSIVSHYNNQYDGIGGFAAQFMRSGDRRWWTLMDDLAVHVADIDIYHTDLDKPAYNHGLFWHTFHYVPAGRSSHRSYPRHPKVWGGGPANEHNYTAGLRLHWLLTGNPESRDAAVGLARWVVEMDEGRNTVLRWLSTAPTGLASATQAPDFHGPGRGAGHSILALLDGHRLTGEARLLAKADELIRRCVHPDDEIAAHDLLDAERRWSYVVFLQALGKYLEYTHELGQHDTAYARAALLHYARWMAVHEYPYLEKPEILEYPTETWAAQDMRKCEVFLFAACHASGDERARLLDRADHFFDASVSTLGRHETRTCTRPLVLLLSNGPMYLGFDPSLHVPGAQPETVTFATPAPFVRQKTAAKKRLVLLAGVLAAVVVMAAIAAVL